MLLIYNTFFFILYRFTSVTVTVGLLVNVVTSVTVALVSIGSWSVRNENGSKIESVCNKRNITLSSV